MGHIGLKFKFQRGQGQIINVGETRHLGILTLREYIRLVQDNLNTHTPGSFYEVLDPEKAFALSQRFEMHDTPKKGSWLNMAEIEFAALSTQCLDRRIGDVETLSEEVQAWTTKRNLNRTTVNWQFTQSKVRSKLHRHYHNVRKLI